ncbi:MAG: pirin family protein [Thermoplasmatota archaeon]
MQKIVQRSGDRGGGREGWLDTRHSFSFADWYDPAAVSWGPLRVLNEDRIAARSGFGMHPHRDMEIVTYVLQGEVHHRDSAGSDGIVRPGEAQRMSAGTGVLHSEMNDADGELHLLQIWIAPSRRALPPSYEQQVIPAGARERGWHTVAEGRPGRPRGPGTVAIQQDAAILATVMQPRTERRHAAPGRRLYLFVVSGEVEAAGEQLEAGDSLRLSGLPELTVQAANASHVLLFDLPGT